MEGITIDQGRYGIRAVITSPWREEMGKHLIDAGIIELELNDGKGWRGSDLSFLALLPQLKVLEILDLRLHSVAPIHSLHELRELTITTYCDTEIRFSAFLYLERCSLEWRPKAYSVFECTTLKDLFINQYRGKDVAAFTKLFNLESLAISNATIETISGLSMLQNLRSLSLVRLNCLNSLDGIEGLANLEELEIVRCRRIGSVEQLGSLSKLRKLYLNDNGDIESLRPLAKLNRLEWVLFYESTNILDGDLTPVMRQPNLKRVSFKNRRHYTHRREDFQDSTRAPNRETK